MNGIPKHNALSRAQVMRNMFGTTVPKIVTPLTYMDAVSLAERLALDLAPLVIVPSDPSSGQFIAALDKIAKALMAVDVASREQSGRKELIEALNQVTYHIDNECPGYAYRTAIKAVEDAERMDGTEPIEAVSARIRSTCSDDYADNPSTGWRAK